MMTLQQLQANQLNHKTLHISILLCYMFQLTRQKRYERKIAVKKYLLCFATCEHDCMDVTTLTFLKF